MSSTYKGDSPAKRMARLNCWVRALAESDYQNRPGPILCLAGDGGDVSVLRGLGVPTDRIYVADIDAEACDRVRDTFPGVRVFCEDVRKTTPRARWRVVFLDFCTHVSADSLDAVGKGFWAIDWGGVMVAAFMKGREKLDEPVILAERQLSRNRAARRRRRDDGKLMSDFTRDGAKTRDMLMHLRKTWGPTLARGLLVSYSLVSLRADSEWCGTVDYFSSTRSAGGVPMAAFLYRKVKSGEAREGGIMERALLQVSSYTQADAERYVAENLANGADPKLYNLTPAQAAAIKAHLTMGTYAKKLKARASP